MATTRLFDFIHHQQKNNPLKKSIGSKVNGEWKYYSTEEVIESANKFSCGLLKLGVKKNDKIALITYNNRPEWSIADIGIQQIGAITVPVYPNISPREYEYIFNDAEIKYCFLGTDDLYEKVEIARKKIPSLIDIYTFDRQKGIKFWEDIFTDGGYSEVKQIMDSIDPKEMATIIYTSGTTGNPKGVMLSHENIASNVLNVDEIMPIDPGDTILSFLPLCHVFERSASYAYQYRGVTIAYTGTDNLGGETGDLQTIKPHFFTTVPRLLEKVYEKIYNKGLGLTGTKKKLFFWALSLTEDYAYDKKFGGISSIKRNIADKLIFSKWRQALGGNIKGILTGAAPCPISMTRIFSAAGIPIREGYGLTETSPGLTINRYDKGNAMLGTVGPTLGSVKIHIDSSEGDYKEGEGEILAIGPNVMMGYYKQEEKTKEVFKEIDGKKWFRTGDIGKILKSGNTQFLKITDRKKELLKTSGGKYVAPAPIENALKEDFLIEQVMVVGDKKKFVSAIIIPAKEALENWCKGHQMTNQSFAEMITDEKVINCYQEIINKCNPKFSHIEQIKKFKLLDAEWEASKEDGSDAELTPTMKLKRRVIAEKFKKDIDDMYV